MASDAPVLELRGVNHGFGELNVLHDLNVTIRRGQIVGLVGPSGCGKSTLLRAILGTHLPRQGKIRVYSGDDHSHGRTVAGPGRDRGIVYQRYSLFPFLTALQNVAFGLMLDQTSLPFRVFQFPRWWALKKQHKEEAAKYLESVGLAHAMHQYPHQMSGGMQQRVAIAQALVMKPEILLLDEPFGALDEAMREDLQRMLLRLYAENVEADKKGERPPYTILMVTHELNEALYVGDRIMGLSQFWDWKSAGHTKSPGATIVYDKPTPVFEANAPRDYEVLASQRQEVLEVVFNPEAKSTPSDHVHVEAAAT